MKQYINTPIVLYDELVLICGDDEASGSFARDHYDTPHVESEEFDMGDDDLESPNTHADTPFTDTPQVDTPSSMEPSQSSAAKTKTGKHRLAAPVEVMQAIVERVGDVANSILKLKEETVDRDALLQALL